MGQSQSNEERREVQILHAVMAIEQTLETLAKAPDAPRHFLKNALYKASEAGGIAKVYFNDASFWHPGKTSELNIRTLNLGKLSRAVYPLENARKDIASDLATAQDLSPFFRAAVKRCDTAIGNAITLIDKTVTEGRHLIQSQRARIEQASEVLAREPAKPVVKHTVLRLVISQ